jgi:hypothetical protein
MQEYRFSILIAVARLFELVGIRRPLRFEQPVEAGTYDEAVHSRHPDDPSVLLRYFELPAAQESKGR